MDRDTVVSSCIELPSMFMKVTLRVCPSVTVWILDFFAMHISLSECSGRNESLPVSRLTRQEFTGVFSVLATCANGSGIGGGMVLE